MGKPRMTALAIAIKAAEPLSDEEKQTLRDVLRPAPKPRQKGKAAICKIPNCGALIKSNIHDPEHSSFQHLPLAKPEHKPSQKRKAGKETTVEVCAWESCKKPVDHNVHHMMNYEGYHEFLPPAAGEASKGVGA